MPHLQPQERPNIEECPGDGELHDFLLAAIGFGTCQGPMWSVTYVVFSWTMMAEVPLIAMDYQDLQGER